MSSGWSRRAARRATAETTIAAASAPRACFGPWGMRPARSAGSSWTPCGIWRACPPSEERVRILVLQRALEEAGTAEQLANRLEPFVHAAVGLSPARRRAILEEVVLPGLRKPAVDPRIPWTCARIGVCARGRGRGIPAAGVRVAGDLGGGAGRSARQGGPDARAADVVRGRRAGDKAAPARHDRRRHQRVWVGDRDARQ